MDDPEILQQLGAASYAGALAVAPGIQALTRNVLHHMGVTRPGASNA
jgi:hypothetical protein